MEILERVFRFLCIHCWYGDHHGTGGGEALVSLGPDMYEVLAKAGRTCRALATITQPILFHFYHTGNQPLYHPVWKTWKPYFWETNAGEDDMVYPFIRTLFSRPDLAAHVRALALFYAQCDREVNKDDEPAGLNANPNLKARIYAFRSQFLLQKDPDRVLGDLSDGIGVCFDWNNDLCDIVVALCPNVEQLHMGGVPPTTVFMGDWDR